MEPKHWHILLVEDEFDSIQMLSKILRHSGVTVTAAANGYECLEKLNVIRPTLVIMDLAMPRMDGWVALSKIRSNPSTAELPVVAITAYHSGDVAEDAVEAGFDGYFPKPIDTINFVRHLAGILDNPA